jgi:hypothetical protein
MQLGSAVQPARAGLVLISLIAVAAGRQPEPASREFRAALDRPGIRFLADDSGFDRGRLLAAVGCIGPLSWRAWRSLRAQADAHSRHGTVRSGLPVGRLCPIRRVLFAARVLGGISAGMAYPTTLALVAALWSGPGRYSRGLSASGAVARLHRLPLLPALDRVHDDPGPEADDHDASDHLSGNQHPSRLGHGRNITEPDG